MNQEEYPLDPNDLENAYRIAYLIAGHIRKTLTSVERLELDAWLDESERNFELFEELTDEENLEKALNWYRQKEQEESFKKLKQKIPFVSRKKVASSRLLPFVIAASFILLLGVGLAVMLEKNTGQVPKRIIHTAGTKADIVPGTNKAVLTLGDGTQVVLESAGNGNIAIQGNSQIVKTDSSLSYNENGQAGIKQEIQFNVLTTPKGGIYKLILPDGTRVWLNAASSLRYPIAFSGSSRQVRLSGEGYFEIAHNASQPFLVQVEGMEIKDIGTTFDIKSYKDEDMIRATVLQGSIRVSKGNSSKILRPGEEAQVDGEKIEVVPADTEEAIGWKQGQFVFHKTPMGMVMRELERWYDIKVENKDGNHNHLNATIDRNVPLSKVLHYLEGSIELNFLPAERKLIVLK